jgi:ubiquitin carboxyl-terminal hydrolase 5/13
MDLLLSAGFSENASKRAVLNNQGQDAEACMNWLFAHLDDADINDPIPNASASAPKV